MKGYIEVKTYFAEDVMEEIETIVQYKRLKDLLYSNENNYHTTEEFIVGCVIHYIKTIKHQIDLSGIDDLGKPYRLQNKFKEYMDKHGIAQSELAKMTGIGESNISLILRNKNQSSLDYFFRIWIALKCPPLNKILYRLEE